MKICISIAFLLLVKFSFAQSPEEIENSLIDNLKKINYWASNHEYSDSVLPYDSVSFYNSVFADQMLSYANTEPSILKYKFEKLKGEGLMIADSDDGLFRIYSWDTWTGGTMHVFSNVYQFKVKNKVVADVNITEGGDPGCFYSEIKTLKANGKTYYLAINHAILSTKESYQTVKAFSIENNKLNDKVKLIKTKSGLQNELGFDYDFFSVVDRPERPVKLIYYDKLKKTLKIPVVLENGKVTDRFITYIFTGKYFEKLK